jgi:hypothetical protein
MSTREAAFAYRLSRVRCEKPQGHFFQPDAHGDSRLFRQWLRNCGVPVLELNGAPQSVALDWLTQAMALSAEYLVPIVVFGGEEISSGDWNSAQQEEVADVAWLSTRQIALTSAIERSPLNQECRRTRDKSGALYLGWQPDLEQYPGNHLMLAWSSPLPLRRIRDFAARCPEIVASGPYIDSLAADVGAQGISVAQWRFEVK